MAGDERCGDQLHQTGKPARMREYLSGIASIDAYRWKRIVKGDLKHNPPVAVRLSSAPCVKEHLRKKACSDEASENALECRRRIRFEGPLEIRRLIREAHKAAPMISARYRRARRSVGSVASLSGGAFVMTRQNIARYAAMRGNPAGMN